MTSLSKDAASGRGMNYCNGLTTPDSSADCSGTGKGLTYTDGSGDGDGYGFGVGKSCGAGSNCCAGSFSFCSNNLKAGVVLI